MSCQQTFCWQNRPVNIRRPPAGSKGQVGGRPVAFPSKMTDAKSTATCGRQKWAERIPGSSKFSQIKEWFKPRKRYAHIRARTPEPQAGVPRWPRRPRRPLAPGARAGATAGRNSRTRARVYTARDARCLGNHITRSASGQSDPAPRPASWLEVGTLLRSPGRLPSRAARARRGCWRRRRSRSRKGWRRPWCGASARGAWALR